MPNNDFFDEEKEPLPRVRHRTGYAPSEDPEAVNRPPRRSVVWRALRPVLALVIGVAIVAAAGLIIFNKMLDDYILPVDETSTQLITVEIPNGASVSAIADALEENGIINSSFAFKYYVDFVDMTSKMQAGTYQFSPSMSFDDIIDVIKRNANTRSTITITLKEGSTVEEIAEQLMNYNLFDGKSDTFLSIAKTGEGFPEYKFVADAIADNAAHSEKRHYVLEGYLFADTYEFYTDVTEHELISRLLQRFNEVFESQWITRAEDLGMSIDDVVAMASVIEREAKTADFAKVAAVFHNRLKTGMKLQSDATVQYATGKKKLVFTDKELQTKSLFNTYVYDGLPLGPISQPSKAAMEAALYPDEQIVTEEYLYFCLADPATGELVFAKTLKDHNNNVEKYRPLWEAYDKQSQTK